MEKRKVVNVMLTILTLTLVLAINIVNVGANPERIIHNPWNPPGLYLGETKKNISLKSDIYLCQPIPTDNTGEGVKWNMCNVDFTYSLQQSDPNSAQYFPLNDLPSGGNSGRISKSEMVIAVVNLLDNDPMNGYVQYSWFKKGVGSTDKLLVQTEKLSVPACGGYPHIGDECGIYTSVENYEYIGHFSGEIVEGGYYYVLIDTTWGQARIDFEVVAPDDGNNNPGDGVSTVVTPVPEATPVQKTVVATPVVTPVIGAVSSNSFSYNTGNWIGSGFENFLSGVVHGFWNSMMS